MFVPIFIKLSECPVLVVGGGTVAQRKIEAILESGARITVISPRLTAKLNELAKQGKIHHVARCYQDGDMMGYKLVYGATDDPVLHQQLATEARRYGAMLNVADQLELCDFVVPAVLRRGDLTVAVSTGGCCPAFARRVCRELEVMIGPEYELSLEIMKRARKRLRAASGDIRERMAAINALADARLEEPLRRRDFDCVDEMLVSYLGDDFSLLQLGFTRERLNAFLKTGKLSE